MKIVFLGPPGSGKGTQARKLSRALGDVNVVDVGDLLRKEGGLSKDSKKKMNSGGLLSDDIVNDFVKSKISPVISDFILDGFPRTLVQARFLDDFLCSKCDKIDYIIRLVVADGVLIKRLTQRRSCSVCGAVYTNNIKNCLECNGQLVIRTDDSLEVVKLRLTKYHEASKDIIRFYGDKILNFDGSDDIDNVTKKIMVKIDLRA